MQYLVYFAVVTPLLLVWLFWASATAVPPPAGSPLFHSFDEDLHQADVLKERALADLNTAETGVVRTDSHTQRQALSARPMKPPAAR